MSDNDSFALSRWRLLLRLATCNMFPCGKLLQPFDDSSGKSTSQHSRPSFHAVLPRTSPLLLATMASYFSMAPPMHSSKRRRGLSRVCWGSSSGIPCGMSLDDPCASTPHAWKKGTKVCSTYRGALAMPKASTRARRTMRGGVEERCGGRRSIGRCPLRGPGFGHARAMRFNICNWNLIS